ncbi:MAG: DUF2794 domain-containing protein [Methylovirgula sp.]|nr:DUF2794 domain-containing protein [Methylovirgula sp.]
MSMESADENFLAARVVPLAQSHTASTPPRSAPAGPAQVAQGPQVSFDRQELRDILDLYGRKVAAGEWRDYAIAFTSQTAVFSIYRRAAEFPLYRIEKNPKAARKQGLYSVIAATGLILKRGHDLKRVINVLEKRLSLVSG